MMKQTGESTNCSVLANLLGFRRVNANLLVVLLKSGEILTSLRELTLHDQGSGISEQGQK